MRIFPIHFALVSVSGADRFFVKIAFGRAIDRLRPAPSSTSTARFWRSLPPKHLAGERYFLPLCDT